MKKLLILVLMLAVVCAVFTQEAEPVVPDAPVPAVPAQYPPPCPA